MAQAKLASRFVRRPEVLGIELLNEPFAGALIGR
jgi:aryl-phospho-beta-D-glucosidase BglC (GH1 family)